jgi:ketosteroid isomerase-like protein
MTVPQPYKNVIAAYLDAFCAHSMDGILACFSADAAVHSPTQDAPKTPAAFYPPVLARSQGVKFTIRDFFAGETPEAAAALLSYHKPMPDGSVRVFDCVDIFTFDRAGRIRDLRIVFDTKKLVP